MKIKFSKPKPFYDNFRPAPFLSFYDKLGPNPFLSFFGDG